MTHLEPAALAELHKDAIFAVVIAQAGGTPDDCTLVTDQSFKGESEPNAYGFLVLHAKGMYGVYGNLKDGTLQNVRVTPL